MLVMKRATQPGKTFYNAFCGSEGIFLKEITLVYTRELVLQTVGVEFERYGNFKISGVSLFP